MSHTFTRPAPLADHDIALLRLLGRLGAASGMALHPLAYPDQHVATRNRQLGRLVELGLLWRGTVPHPNRDAMGCQRGQSPHVYGLTERGKELLGLERVEHEAAYERLIARPDDAPAPDADTLACDVAMGDWLAALLERVRREPALAGVQVQRAYTLHDADDAPVYTLGALVVLAFDPSCDDPSRPWPLPWGDGEGRVLNWTYCWLALELDGGLVGRRELAAQATTYRQLAERAYYDQLPLLDDTVRPVVLAASAARATSIRELWADAWPGNPALVVSQAGVGAMRRGAASDVDTVMAAILPPGVSDRGPDTRRAEPPLSRFSP